MEETAHLNIVMDSPHADAQDDGTSSMWDDSMRHDNYWISHDPKADCMIACVESRSTHCLSSSALRIEQPHDIEHHVYVSEEPRPSVIGGAVIGFWLY